MMRACNGDEPLYSECHQEVLHFASGASPGKLDETPLSLGLVASKPPAPLFSRGLAKRRS
jgi:hypothetical protein